ncbi:UmoD family flagellar biogenesis regulator [Xenorhabdus griffiniae]|uniref:UmoD family flagellar biogenesis regulator n=1 Tax=Xenorhabdus griffiniae TaxID=351672 RepID=UPI00064A38C1|nr:MULTISPECIES: UmoD family flagellar biogenesis regulator [Xenorhabdus]KLU16552.1 UmoD [Xenorhabdus griffiniae]KOP32651.1 UmoD [Xenorhabdus sp. GDc328]
MVKLTIRQYVMSAIMTIIAIAIIGIAATFYFESPRPSVAHVLSSEPIKSTVVFRQSYCHIAVFPIPVTVKGITHNHLIKYEYRILTLINHLKINRKYPVLTHSALKNCIDIHFKKPRVVAYDVNYVIGEQPGKVRIEYKPNDSIPLNEKGQLILKSYSPQ